MHTQLVADVMRRDRGLNVLISESAQAVKATAMDRAINVLVISSNLEGQAQRGFEIVRELRGSSPGTRCVLLLDSSSPECILEAFRAGARGVFSRFESVEKLSKCVRCVHEGQIWASSQQLQVALDVLASVPTFNALDAKGMNLLSKRETDIVQCVAGGLTNREIADRLHLSQHTVKNYIFRIFNKLGVSNRVELLFLTVSQSSNAKDVSNSNAKRAVEPSLQYNAPFLECQRAAQEGSVTAQLLLAEMYRTRNNPEDHIVARKWNLIAIAMMLDADQELSETMSREQLIEAERMADDWLKKKHPIRVCV